jgi:hypothetical protein
VLGTLLLAAPAVAAAVWVRVRVNPPDDLPAFDIILVAGSAVVAVGLVLGGWIADQYTSFDPRYIYISLALTPVAALLTALRAMLRRRAVGR